MEMRDRLIDKLLSSYEAAATTGGTSKVTLSIGAHHTELSFAGAKLQQALLPSLSGLKICGQQEARHSLKIYLWDATNGINFFCESTKKELQQHLDKRFVITNQHLHLQYNPEGEILSVIDTEKRIAFYFTPDPSKLPDYEVSAPMRMILNWFCRMNNLLLIHAAAIGFNGTGVLLAGRGGAGKSTTSLSSLINGFDFIGDDYIAISTKGNRIGYPIYRGCKLSDEALQKLPTFAPYKIEANRTQQKNVIMLDENIGKLVPSLSIDMIIRPAISHAAISSFEKLPVMQLLSEFAGSTILQMPGSGASMLGELTEICRELPSYTMRLSNNFLEIAESLKSFLKNPECRPG